MPEPTEAQRQATDFVLKHIEMYKKDKDWYDNEWYGDEHIWYIFTEDFEGWTEERFRLAKKSVNKELRRTLRYRGLKLTTIFSGLGQSELSLLAEPVTILNLPGGAGRYCKIVFSGDHETHAIREKIFEYLVEPFKNESGAIQLKILYVRPEERGCHPSRSGYEIVIPFELDRKPSLRPWPQKRNNQTTIIPRHHYDTILALSQVNSCIRKELGSLLFNKVQVNIAAQNMPQALYKLLDDRPQLYDRIEKLAITINPTGLDQKEFNDQCERMKEVLKKDFKEFTLTINTSSAVAKRILAKGKKIPWVKYLREMHVASMNVFVGLTDDAPINKSCEKVGGALTQDICSKFRDLLGVYSNDTVFGRRFLVAADARPRSATFTSSDGFIILNFPEDDFNAIDVNGHHNIVGNRGSRLRLNITFRSLDFSPRLPKLFQFLTRNLVISELHVVILTTKRIAESLIHDASGITWVQMMKNLAISEHFFLRAVFLSQCETCEFCKDEEMNDLIHKLLPQLRKALLPNSTWKDLRANEKPISSQWYADSDGRAHSPKDQSTLLQRQTGSKNNNPSLHDDLTASEKDWPLVSTQLQNSKGDSRVEEKQQDEISPPTTNHSPSHYTDHSRDMKYQSRWVESPSDYIRDNEEPDELVRPKPLKDIQYRPGLRITPAKGEWDDEEGEDGETHFSGGENSNSQYRSSLDSEVGSATKDDAWPLKDITSRSVTPLGSSDHLHPSFQRFDDQPHDLKSPRGTSSPYRRLGNRMKGVLSAAKFYIDPSDQSQSDESKYIQPPRPKIYPYFDRFYSERTKSPDEPDDPFQSDGFEFPDSPNYGSGTRISPQDRRQSNNFEDVDLDQPSITRDEGISCNDDQLQNGSQYSHEEFDFIDLGEDSRTEDTTKTEKKPGKFKSMFRRGSKQSTQTSQDECTFGDESDDSDTSIGGQILNQEYELNHKGRRDRLKGFFRKPKIQKSEFYIH
ncbi:hypothetical protein HYFRA_00006494 [Hymenoscyphus fraxineus]|uniref:Uncharacterized protein n=1 Tax=Hymenoscyphus fraxineus TaxID=746836 RepID=A0A9N9PLG3_9HELO|nr:hypothetical protein HYFRA_00006494 [Hymenoscyphus fraxineus]